MVIQKTRRKSHGAVQCTKCRMRLVRLLHNLSIVRPRYSTQTGFARFLMSVSEKLTRFLRPSLGVTAPECAVVDYGVLYMGCYVSD
jgi:hypothetical protein